MNVSGNLRGRPPSQGEADDWLPPEQHYDLSRHSLDANYVKINAPKWFDEFVGGRTGVYNDQLEYLTDLLDKFERSPASTQTMQPKYAQQKRHLV